MKKLTSEELRLKSKNLNPCLSRISTKNVLRELTQKGLVDSELRPDHKRYYKITKTGESLFRKIDQLFSKTVFDHNL